MFLGVENGFSHGINRFNWVFTIGSLIRQHHDISTLDDRVCHVAHFSAAWLRIVNHATHHLSCYDHHLAVLATQCDNPSLYDWHNLSTSFHRQVSSRHHDTITQLHDFFQVFWRDGRFCLNLGDDLRFRTKRQQTLPQVNDIRCRLHEAQRNIIKVSASPPFNVF